MTPKLLPLLPLTVVLLGSPGLAQETEKKRPIAPARRTDTVVLIEKALPTVASLQTVQKTGTEGVFTYGVGSASVLHESGYLLTNQHVVGSALQGHAFLVNRQPLQFRKIAALASEDLAVIKVDSPTPLPALPLGRSDDLMLGEPVLTIGNPGGLSHSVSAGIVSGLNRSTVVNGGFLPWMIQTSAAVSGGNSGGPLINALGEQIGVITGKKMDGENINFAIAVDRVRHILPELLAVELRYEFLVGLQVDRYQAGAVIISVTEKQPAAEAGLKVGDVIKSVAGMSVRQGIDVHLALVERKAGDELKVMYEREGKESSANLVLGKYPLAEPTVKEGMEPGIAFEGFTGGWERLPDFDKLEVAKEGKVEKPTEEAFQTESKENYALRFRGYVEIPKDGLYSFYTSSDDGSRLSIGEEVLVDNDGLHAVRRVGRMCRLKAGLHPIEVTFFEAMGDEELLVEWEGPDLSRQEIPAEAYFVKKEE